MLFYGWCLDCGRGMFGRLVCGYFVRDFCVRVVCGFSVHLYDVCVVCVVVLLGCVSSWCVFVLCVLCVRWCVWI